jgi:hypothetical protein
VPVKAGNCHAAIARPERRSGIVFNIAATHSFMPIKRSTEDAPQSNRQPVPGIRSI